MVQHPSCQSGIHLQPLEVRKAAKRFDEGNVVDQVYRDEVGDCGQVSESAVRRSGFPWNGEYEVLDL